MPRLASLVVGVAFAGGEVGSWTPGPMYASGSCPLVKLGAFCFGPSGASPSLNAVAPSMVICHWEGAWLFKGARSLRSVALCRGCGMFWLLPACCYPPVMLPSYAHTHTQKIVHSGYQCKYNCHPIYRWCVSLFGCACACECMRMCVYSGILNVAAIFSC